MKIFQTLLDVATLPIEVAKDIVTLGGVAAGRHKTFTRERCEQIDDDISD